MGYWVPNKPSELSRQADQGGGAGVETLWTRRTWIIHPSGYKVVGTPSKLSFNNAELSLATTFERVVPRKNIPMAFIVRMDFGFGRFWFFLSGRLLCVLEPSIVMLNIGFAVIVGLAMMVGPSVSV